MEWNNIAGLLQDGNSQNKHAANAGDGPKHIAWLTLLEVLGGNLKAVVETHSGGGIYHVPMGRFCVGLPEESILGRHQESAKLPLAGGGMAYYSASGDQALGHMPQGCKYIAFDRCDQTAQRLAAVASWRGRASDLDGRASAYTGNGDPKTGLPALLGKQEHPILAMVDPFGLSDLQQASCDLARVKGLRTILFGVARKSSGGDDSERSWESVVERFSGEQCITWRWTGNAAPHEPSHHLFFLLVATPDQGECEVILDRLREEHAVLLGHRKESHAYASSGPQARKAKHCTA